MTIVEPSTINAFTVAQALQQAIILHQAGRFQDAESLYRTILRSDPNHPDANHNLGVLAVQLNQPAVGLPFLKAALEVNSGLAQYWLSYIDALIKAGQQDLARLTLREGRQKGLSGDAVVALEGRLAEPTPEEICRLGTLFNQGFFCEAESTARGMIERFPQHGFGWKVLGAALMSQGLSSEALKPMQKAVELLPMDAEAHNNLGNTFKELDRPLDSEASCRRALEINPDYTEAHFNLGNALKNMNKFDEAEASFRRALQFGPDYAPAHIYLGNILRDMGRLEEAGACYRRAHQLGSSGARVKELFMLPAIMGTKQEILASRVEFEQNLDKLIADKVTLDDPLFDVGETNFYLAFHGINDRDVQVKVAKFYEQACPSLLYVAPHCIKPKPDSRNIIRIGFFSKFLYNHSVSLSFSKIIESLSLKDQFEVYLISDHAVDEKFYSEFAGKCVQLPFNLVRAREMLAELELDILVYLDIGMEPFSYFLAFSRLARTQCVLYGHPVTTGITNMDYFLSSDQMEPNDADEHYSEKLVRFPRLIFYFTRPIVPATLKTRQELNLPDGRHIYMCPMQLQKIHPDFDEVLARILQLDGNGVVVLFEDLIRPFWKKALVKRFEITIPAEVQERIIFLPWLRNPNDFVSAIASADVILDSFHFGIGSTTAMTCITGTPLITKPGEFLRGRQGSGFCRMLDVTECIADDTEGYARKAVEIASDSLLQERIRAKILRNNSVIYENLQPVDDLIKFINSLQDGWHTVSFNV